MVVSMSNLYICMLKTDIHVSYKFLAAGTFMACLLRFVRVWRRIFFLPLTHFNGEGWRMCGSCCNFAREKR